jgi:hypothetical protein
MGYKPKEVAMAKEESKTSLKTAVAAKRVFSQLVTLGLINEKGVLTDDGNAWPFGDAEAYKELCSKILKRVYPNELRELYHTYDAEKEDELKNKIADWFLASPQANVRNRINATHMARFYLLLLKADPSDQEKVSAKKPRKPVSKVEREAKKPKAKAEKKTGEQPQQGKLLHFEPSLRVDVQIHIPKDATPEQIDQIFKSMAEHIYKIKK